MQLKQLFDEFDELQKIYGNENLDAIYGCGEINNPDISLIFMNPTARNVSSNKQWAGLKAPWIGTKNIWKMLQQLGLINKELVDKISNKKPSEWNYKFAEEVYREVCNNSLYITNLSKATQSDASPLKNAVFKSYMDLLKKELSIIKPKIIIVFGNQVSSILLNKNIKVSDYRKKHEFIEIDDTKLKVFPVYYPIGQGMRNIGAAKEDIQWILENEKY